MEMSDIFSLAQTGNEISNHFYFLFFIFFWFNRVMPNIVQVYVVVRT